MSPKPLTKSEPVSAPPPPEAPAPKSWLDEAFSADPIGDVLNSLWTLFDAPQAAAARTEALETKNGHEAAPGRTESQPHTVIVKNIFAKSRRGPTKPATPGPTPAPAAGPEDSQ